MFPKSPLILNIDLGDSEGFALNMYLKKPAEKVIFRPEVLGEGDLKIPSSYLNPYLSRSHSFYGSNSDDKNWEMVIFLTSLGTGNKILQESIETLEKETIIDGIQSYIIKSKNLLESSGRLPAP